MIDPKELRVGNYWMHINGSIHQIAVPIQIADASIFGVGIPLTCEWLERFGFFGKYKSVHTHWNLAGFSLDQKSDVDEDNNDILEEEIFYYDYRYEIKYVHQLQNLHLDLKGTELTYNPNQP